MGKKLYVGNLSYSVDSSELEQLFGGVKVAVALGDGGVLNEFDGEVGVVLLELVALA